MMTPKQIADVAVANGIPADVLMAMLRTESGPKMDREQRFEPNHYERITRPRKGDWLAKFHTDDDDENRGRATSWGVGHIMGWRLRDMGYAGRFADLNSEDVRAAGYAARALCAELRRAKVMIGKFPFARDVYELAVALYNTGDGKPWPVRHIERFRYYRKESQALVGVPA